MKIVKYTFRKWKKSKTRPRPCYWIEELPYDLCQRTRCGPYEDREEAQHDMNGMQTVLGHVCTGEECEGAIKPAELCGTFFSEREGCVV